MRLRHHLANWTLALCSLLVVLLLVEVALRVVAHLENRGLLGEALASEVEAPSPDEGEASLGHLIRLTRSRRLIYELKPDLEVTYMGARVTTNPRGLRGLAVEPGPPPPGVFRIVGLGDSFMFGHGVADGEAYLELLAADLEERFAEHGWEVVNTAVPGYNTVMEVAALHEKGLLYHPDLVILEFVGNDLALPNFIRTKRPVLSLRRSFLFDFVARRKVGSGRLWSQLSRQGMAAAPRDDDNPRAFQDDPEKVPAEYRDMVGWRAYEAAMADLAAARDEHGFDVASISLIPGRSKLKRRALDVGRRHGFAVIDVGAELARRLRAEGYKSWVESPYARSLDDGHPSARGHRLAADALLRGLVEQGLVPAS